MCIINVTSPYIQWTTFKNNSPRLILRTSINLACNNLNTFITDKLNICNCIKLFIFTLSYWLIGECDDGKRFWHLLSEWLRSSFVYREIICTCAFYIFTDVWCPFLVDSVLCVCVCVDFSTGYLSFYCFYFFVSVFYSSTIFCYIVIFSHIIYYPL